jgi:hypothetical protein
VGAIVAAVLVEPKQASEITLEDDNLALEPVA